VLFMCYVITLGRSITRILQVASRWQTYSEGACYGYLSCSGTLKLTSAHPPRLQSQASVVRMRHDDCALFLSWYYSALEWPRVIMSIHYHQPTCINAQKYRTELYADDQTGACNDERAVAPLPVQKRSRAEAQKRKIYAEELTSLS